MRLDRNINTDGRGKYALLNLRTNKIQWGNTPEDEFFVVKLRDKFAVSALLAYVESVESHARELQRKANGSITAIANDYNREALEWEEYAHEIRILATRAANNPCSKLPD